MRAATLPEYLAQNIWHNRLLSHYIYNARCVKLLKRDCIMDCMLLKKSLAMLHCEQSLPTSCARLPIDTARAADATSALGGLVWDTLSCTTSY